MKPLCPTLSLIALILAFPVTSDAATWTVLADGSGDVPTIRDAVNLAADGDVIELGDGGFRGDGNRDVDFLGKAITIRSASGDPALCVIDCQGSEQDQHRGFLFQSGEGPDARLEGVSIINGYLYDEDPIYDGVGGALLVVEGSSPALHNLVLAGNTAMVGGGLFVMNDAHPTVTECRFESNSAWWGSGGGAGVWDMEGVFADCVFQGNSANQGGGGLACVRGAVTVERCEFYENQIQYYGGGFECFLEGEFELIECTFAGNLAGESGGGAYCWSDAQATFRHCTFVGNGAPYAGGVGSEMDGAVDLRNTIIANSIAGSAVHCVGTAMSLNCCNLYGNANGDWVGCAEGQLGVTGNISEDPLFCGELNPENPYTVHAESPCAPSQYPCGQMGAWPVGCSAADVEESWDSVVAAGVRWRILPNPLGPETTVAFSLEKTQPVRIALYDLSGRRVRALVDAAFDAGDHSAVWDGCSDRGHRLPAGCYLMRIRAGNQAESRKVVVLD